MYYQVIINNKVTKFNNNGLWPKLVIDTLIHLYNNTLGV